jgi:hypothetical protein
MFLIKSSELIAWTFRFCLFFVEIVKVNFLTNFPQQKNALFNALYFFYFERIYFDVGS